MKSCPQDLRLRSGNQAAPSMRGVYDLRDITRLQRRTTKNKAVEARLLPRVAMLRDILHSLLLLSVA